MGFYESYVLPRLLHLACGTKPIHRQRQKVVPRAEGRVLEIGIGSGLNLGYYDRSKVKKLWGLEPNEAIRTMAEKEAERVGIDVEFLGLPGEEIPLDDRSVDTVVTTYTLCTIPDVERALSGMRRVLKPGGTLLFCEHGAAPDPGPARWQSRLNPYWKRISGGCNLNRRIPDLVRGAGFRIRNVETMYLPSTPRFAGFNYWGAADPAH